MTAARDLLKQHAALFASAKRGDLDGIEYVARSDGAAYSLPDTLKTIQRELQKAARSNKAPFAQSLRDLSDIFDQNQGAPHAQD